MVRSLSVRLTSVLAVVVAALAVVPAVWRPWARDWGATAEEARRALPGDDVIPGAVSQETRAVTVRAPPEDVWPWVAQLGQDRAGFYSYRLLENLVGCRMPLGDHLDPALQSWKPGDKLWMYPPERLGGSGRADLALVEPGRSIVFATRQMGSPPEGPPAGSWAFTVEGTGRGHTRLLVRGRGAPGDGGFLAQAFDGFVFQPAHFVMERKMLTELKARAEGRGPTPWSDGVENIAWTLLAVTFVAGGVLVLRRRPFGRALGAMAFAAGAFQVATYLLLGPFVALLLAMVAILLTPWRARPWVRSSPTPRSSLRWRSQDESPPRSSRSPRSIRWIASRW